MAARARRPSAKGFASHRLSFAARSQWIVRALALVALFAGRTFAGESIWLEAEHLRGIRGYCWPMGKPEMRRTDGHWALSGPGWAAEWNQGGESNFLSIATADDDDRAAATTTLDVPVDGKYFIWVRYGDWREATERFELRVEQPAIGNNAAIKWSAEYGAKPVVEEDNEMKLYFGWAFAWARQEVTLRKGAATLTLASTKKETKPRQIDVIVLTTDASYRPLVKERPANATWGVLDGYRRELPRSLEPLARAVSRKYETPAAWKLHTFADRGFLYLWNTGHTDAAKTWLADKPERVKFPYNIADEEVRKEFEKKYAGRDDVPIFSDPRITPTFHGAGPGVFATDEKTGAVNETGVRFAKWLDDHPGRPWAMMMNYHAGAPIGSQGVAMFEKYRDRYVGSIAGESLGYFYADAEKMRKLTDAAKTRRELVAAFTPYTLELNAEKYHKIFGRDYDKNPYADVISCLSIGNIAAVPLCSEWGARTIGYESAAGTSSLLPMRWAFLRGAARQFGTLTATYRSCNFGDASTIFSDTQSFHAPRNILDNYYSVYSGAGMTWYKMDLWYQYMAGASMFYHEQGFDEFWKPGGTAAAGLQEAQLSPKGKLVDRFLRLTAAESDRGTPYTPVAFLVDYAHGWEPATFWPNSFKNWHEHSDRFLYGDHERMLEEYFWTAYHPIGRESERPMTGTNEVYVPGVFGDMFDVIFAYPDVAKWRTIASYPVVIAAGEIELSENEGKRLAEYVEQGGTLVVADGHLTGKGLAALGLPKCGDTVEADRYRWFAERDVQASQRFRYRPIDTPKGDAAKKTVRVLASDEAGRAMCVAIDRGAGRIVYLSVPHGLGIDRRAIPIVPRLVAHLTRGLMPVEVSGDVEWLVNRTSDSWIVTLMNPAGQPKPQQGIVPTDYRENRSVTIRAAGAIKSARDRLAPEDRIEVSGEQVKFVVPAGGVRIIEIR